MRIPRRTWWPVPHPEWVGWAGLIGVAAAIVLSASPALAQDDFFRSSPGKLAKSHAAFDTIDGCNECHTGGKGLSNDKCLGCHDHRDLRRRIRSGKGFHASSGVRGRKCETCHSDHRGKKFNLMGWDGYRGGQKGFNHRLAGWPLEGKHKVTVCKDCHKNTNRQGLRVFLGESRECDSCHKDEQPHKFKRRAMLKCDRCHSEAVWNPPKPNLRFNHNKRSDARFPQEGSHIDVSCGKCHPRSKFNLRLNDPGNCSHCHESPHGKQLFGKKKCSWCHSPKFRTNRKFRFDHNRRTKFKLKGEHLAISKKRKGCYKCHTKRLGPKAPSRSCGTCHANDNPHKNRFNAFGNPPRCETCHSSSSFKSTVKFNHTKRTRFKLSGRHAEVSCRKCHRGSKPFKFERFDRKKVGCKGCHQHQNVHDDQYKDSECLGCHKMAGRKGIKEKEAKRRYHGPNSSFPLVRGHKSVKCVDCHPNDQFVDTPAECGVRCHEDSLHRGTLGDACSECHVGGTWKAREFDHTDDTEWPLNGLHRTVPKCVDCHPTREYSEAPTNCSAKGCHAKDDAHQGKLGKMCESCHLETGENIFDHNTQAAFKLSGQHLTTNCSECHHDIKFKPLAKDCFGCHPEPEVHKGQYGTLCENCHTTQRWNLIAPLHDVGDFSLRGSHDNVTCRRCHKDTRPLQGTGSFCINCHRQDDIHSNSLSPRCGTCHTQWSFAPAKFDHTNVGCNLTSIHRVLPCYDCHKTGTYRGLSPNCVGCHLDDALYAAANVPGQAAHSGYTACAGCHGPNTWASAIEDEAQISSGTGYGRESICR